MRPGAIAGVGAFALGAAGAGAGYWAGRAKVSRNVPVYAKHWGERPDHDDDAIQLVALGDSAAQGVGASSVLNGYVAVVAARLAAATGRRVATTNLSVAGAVSGDVLAVQVPQLRELAFTPDIVTLDVGGNDVVFRASTVASFAESMERLLAALPLGSFVADVPWVPIPRLARQSVEMATVAQRLIPAAGHRLVRLHDASRAMGVMGYPRILASDWFHPNDNGHLAWADVFWDAIRASDRVAELTRHDFSAHDDLG